MFYTVKVQFQVKTVKSQLKINEISMNKGEFNPKHKNPNKKYIFICESVFLTKNKYMSQNKNIFVTNKKIYLSKNKIYFIFKQRPNKKYIFYL